MSKAAYVWAEASTPCSSESKRWGHMRIAGLRNDVPAPVVGCLESSIKPGGQATVVMKESMIHGNTLKDDIEEFLKY